MAKPTPQTDIALDPASIQKGDRVHHIGSAERRKRDPAKVGQLNLTSMMDVVFQLLIFFVLTAQFVINEGIIPADLPRGQAEKTEDIEVPLDPVIIFLQSAGDDVVIDIPGTPPIRGNFQELFERLRGWRLSDENPSGIYPPDNPIVIRPKSRVRWKHVVNAFNQCVRAKYENVSFAEALRTAG